MQKIKASIVYLYNPSTVGNFDYKNTIQNDVIIFSKIELEETESLIEQIISRFEENERLGILIPTFSTKEIDASLNNISIINDFSIRYDVFAVKCKLLKVFDKNIDFSLENCWYSFSLEINKYGFSTEKFLCYYPGKFGNANVSIKNDFLSLASNLNFNYDSNLRKKKIGIDFHNLSITYNGTNEYALNVAKNLIEFGNEENVIWEIIAEKDFSDFFKLTNLKVRIVSLKDINYIYDLLFIPYQVYTLEHLSFVNEIAVKYIVCMHDAIALRSDYISPSDKRLASFLAMKYADKVISVSAASARDIENYYRCFGLDLEVESILNSKEFKPSEEKDSKGDHILVVGNFYLHKGIRLTLQSFLNVKFEMKIIVIGDQSIENEFLGKIQNIIYYSSGSLSENLVQDLYSKAAILIFPSVYEGFGFPILNALKYDKKVIVYNSAVNHELKDNYDSKNRILFFNYFEEIASLIFENIYNDREEPIDNRNDLKIDRTWKDVSTDVFENIKIVLETKDDLFKIKDRFFTISLCCLGSLDFKSQGMELRERLERAEFHSKIYSKGSNWKSIRVLYLELKKFLKKLIQHLLY